MRFLRKDQSHRCAFPEPNVRFATLISSGTPIMAEFSNPSPRGRAKRYRKYAADALRQAALIEPSQRGPYIEMAAKWNYLAEGIEADLLNFIEAETEPEKSQPKKKSANQIPK